MPKLISLTFLTLLVLVTCKYGSCICKQSYQTVCDSLDDYEKFYDESWTDIIIKPNSKTQSKKGPFRVVKFRNLNSVTIVNLVNKLEDDDNTCPYEIKLTSLNFYENSIKTIKEGNFLRFLTLHKLGLVNNGIETLNKNAFALPQIEVIDLSNNKLEKIESGTFISKRGQAEIKTRQIMIKNNMLSNIEPHSFPHSLEILKLDNNNLKILRDNVFDELGYLQGLYLSNNQLSAIPNISSLYNLRVLDVSFNKINTIGSQVLSKMPFLQILDLNHNQISSVDFLKPALVKQHRLEVFLTFNLVQNLNGLDINGTVSRKVLNLYGNPWLCNEWPSVENYMRSIHLKRSKCDLEAFNYDNASFCKSSYSEPLKEYVEEFYKEVTGKGHLLKCDYVRKNYGTLYYQKSIDLRCNSG